MKKLLISLSLLVPFFVHAQLKVVAQGPLFEEPESGIGRVMMLKNGNTAYVRVTAKDGIDIRLYDPQHKQIAVKNIDPDYGKLKAMSVEALYDINGELNLFISEIEDKIPSLYRLRIDETTGVLKEMKTVATLKKVNMGQGYAIAFGGIQPPGFLVRRDPNSENYAVVRYNTFVSESGERVELIQYNADGSEASRTFLSSPEGKYKYTQILDYVVIGTTVHALIYSYNTEKSGGSANELLLATVKDGKATYANVGQSFKNRINDGLLRYNPVTKNLIFLTLEMGETKKSGWNKVTTFYSVQFSVIDPENPMINTSVDFSNSSVSEKYRKIFKNPKESFTGLPQQMYINPDGSFTVLMEETEQMYRQTKYGSSPSGVLLGSVALITFNEDGSERNSVLIPKSQATNAGAFGNGAQYAMLERLYIANRDNAAARLASGNQFKSLVYLSGKEKSYVMLNDIRENESNLTRGKITTISGVGDCEAWVYDLSTTKSETMPVPERKALFPGRSAKDRNLGLFIMSDFTGHNGEYATVKLEKGEGVRVIWFSES